jgi:hypothetical protein
MIGARKWRGPLTAVSTPIVSSGSRRSSTLKQYPSCPHSVMQYSTAVLDCCRTRRQQGESQRTAPLENKKQSFPRHGARHLACMVLHAVSCRRVGQAPARALLNGSSDAVEWACAREAPLVGLRNKRQDLVPLSTCEERDHRRRTLCTATPATCEGVAVFFQKNTCLGFFY